MSVKKKNKINNSRRVNFSVKSFFQAYSNALQAKAITFEYSFLEVSFIHNLLKCLLLESRIAGYRFLSEKRKVRVLLSYDAVQKVPFSPKFIFYSCPGKMQIASLKILQYLHKQNPMALTLISTYEGIMPIKRCLQKKCGGQPLITLI